MNGFATFARCARKREASADVNVVEVDRMSGALVDPRLGRITVAEWWDQWWPTVTNLRPSTRARDAQYVRSHVLPTLGSTPLGKLDRTALRRRMVRLGADDGSRLAPATIHKVVQVLNKSVNAAVEDRIITHNPGPADQAGPVPPPLLGPGRRSRRRRAAAHP